MPSKNSGIYQFFITLQEVPWLVVVAVVAVVVVVVAVVIVAAKAEVAAV